MKRAKNSVDSYQTPKLISYEDYVKAKGFLFLRVEGLTEENEIVKRGNKLILGENTYDLREYTLADFIYKLKEYDEELKISLTSQIEKEHLNKISALFLADFNTVKIIQKNILVSPVKKDWILDYKDKLNSIYTLTKFEVYSSITNNLQTTTETDEYFVVYNTKTGVKSVSEYRAIELNIYCLHEIPAGDVGIESLVELGAFHVD